MRYARASLTFWRCFAILGVAGCGARNGAPEGTVGPTNDDLPKVGAAVVVGTLSSAAGQPLAGVLVRVRSAFPRISDEVISDSLGRFEFKISRYATGSSRVPDILPESVSMDVVAIASRVEIAVLSTRIIFDSLSRSAPRTSVTLRAP